MRPLTVEDADKGFTYTNLEPDPNTYDKNTPFIRTHHLCKRCMKGYSLGIPYDLANPPARDLCDDCIINLSHDEFYAEEWNQSERSDIAVLDLDSSKDRLKIIREKLL